MFGLALEYCNITALWLELEFSGYYWVVFAFSFRFTYVPAVEVRLTLLVDVRLIMLVGVRFTHLVHVRLILLVHVRLTQLIDIRLTLLVDVRLIILLVGVR